jgi:hypothetical protein
MEGVVVVRGVTVVEEEEVVVPCGYGVGVVIVR